METVDHRKDFERHLVLTNLTIAAGRAEELLKDIEPIELPLAYDDDRTHQKRRISISIENGTIINVSDVLHDDYHIYNVQISIKRGSVFRITDYRWNIVEPEKQSTSTTIYDERGDQWHPSSESGRIQYISVEGSEELLGLLEKTIDEQTLGVKESGEGEDKETRITLASHDTWIESQLEKGLTGEGLSVAEWLELQTFLIEEERVQDREEAQEALEVALERLARG